MAGLKAARARGRAGGRPKSLNDKQVEWTKRLYNKKKHSINDICKLVGISKTTLYAWLKN